MLKKMSKLIILCALVFGFIWFAEGEEAHAVSTIVGGDTPYTSTKGNFSYKEVEDSPGVKSITITGHDDTIADVEIPEKIYGLPVTKIGANAFSVASALKEIQLPNTLTSIGSYAFYRASALKEIQLPNTLTSIGYSAFEGSGLTSIEIPASMTSIGGYAFSGTSALTSIELPDKLTSIGEFAFSGSGLTSIKIPESMTSIGDSAFSGASALTSIELPDKLTSIGKFAFYNTTALTSINLPNTITSIGDNAFNGAFSLTSIELPDKLTSIDNWAFANTTALKSIELPNTMTSIGKRAFEGSGLQSIKIPESMTSIGAYAFYSAFWLTSIELPNTITSIGASAFEGSGLQKILISNRGASIDLNAFPNLKGVTVYAYTGSTAETYANNRISDNWRFVALHDVTFNSNGGSAVLKEIVGSGTVAKEPTPPTKANHRFAGWYTDTILTIPWNFATDKVTQDMTLYAKWMYVPYVAPPAEILDLSNIGDSSTGIQGIVSPNSYIQIVLNGTELANGRADNEGRFNIEIPNLVAGTELKMIVTNRFGSKKTTFLKVVDQTPPKVTVKPFSDKDTKITGKTEPKAKVKIYINGKLVKTITADANGNYSYIVPKKKAGTTIKIIATDQAGNATTKTFKVLDKTAPAKPIVKAPTTNSTTLTGRAELGSTVYVYKNNRVIAKAKVNAKGKYRLKIPKQKLGTILTLIARDQAKNTSKKTNTKVKRA